MFFPCYNSVTFLIFNVLPRNRFDSRGCSSRRNFKNMGKIAFRVVETYIFLLTYFLLQLLQLLRKIYKNQNQREFQAVTITFAYPYFVTLLLQLVTILLQKLLQSCNSYKELITNHLQRIFSNCYNFSYFFTGSEKVPQNFILCQKQRK